MFNKFKRDSAKSRLIEERLYALALGELESSLVRSGLWAKALADASGDEEKSRGLYLKYRVQAMLDEDVIRHAEQHISSKRRESKKISDASSYWSLREFSLHKGIPEEALIQMIRDGSFEGKLIGDKWYVNKSEFWS